MASRGRNPKLKWKPDIVLVEKVNIWAKSINWPRIQHWKHRKKGNEKEYKRYLQRLMGGGDVALQPTPTLPVHDPNNRYYLKLYKKNSKC